MQGTGQRGQGGVELGRVQPAQERVEVPERRLQRGGLTDAQRGDRVAGAEMATRRARRRHEHHVRVAEEGHRRLGGPHPGRDHGELCGFEVERQGHHAAADGASLAGDAPDGHVAVLDRGAEGDGGRRGRQLCLRQGVGGEGSRERLQHDRQDAGEEREEQQAEEHGPPARRLANRQRSGDRRTRRSRGDDGQPVTFTGTEVPQNSSVMSMSEMAMATVLVRMARPVDRPTPSGPPDAVMP